jgi:glycosyltransferase involved in cell wall biosynthesis
LLIAGDGGLREELEGTVKARRLPVSFAGFLNQSEIPAAYAAADFLVLPSQSETWGLVVNEGMACGLPAIVSDRVGCAEDLVVPSSTGLLYRSGDASELGRRLVEMASNGEARSEMGRAACELVTHHYTVERAVVGTIEALRVVSPPA